MSKTSFSIEKEIRDKVAAKAKEDNLSVSTVATILFLDYANGKIRIGSQSAQEFEIERVEVVPVDSETQALMNEVASALND